MLKNCEGEGISIGSILIFSISTGTLFDIIFWISLGVETGEILEIVDLEDDRSVSTGDSFL